MNKLIKYHNEKCWLCHKSDRLMNCDQYLKIEKNFRRMKRICLKKQTL